LNYNKTSELYPQTSTEEGIGLWKGWCELTVQSCRVAESEADWCITAINIITVISDHQRISDQEEVKNSVKMPFAKT
jgi:hypothetical protein